MRVSRGNDAARALYLELQACGIEVWVEDAFDEDGIPAEEPPSGPVQLRITEEIPEEKLAALVEQISTNEVGLWTVCVSLNERYRAIREESVCEAP